jgi:hypothetical protein
MLPQGNHLIIDSSLNGGLLNSNDGKILGTNFIIGLAAAYCGHCLVGWRHRSSVGGCTEVGS